MTYWWGRLNQPDCLHILTNYKHFFNCLSKHTHSQVKEHVNKAQEVWALYYPLVCLTVQGRVKITEQEWKDQAIKFGVAFVTAYSKEDVTTYIHIFVYHFGFFLSTYGGLEKYSNFALESKHAELKRILAHSTSRFSNGDAEAARQQLHALVRNELHNTIPAPTTTKRRPRTHKPKSNWAAPILPNLPTICDFVDSTDCI
jgi:hypothetical protein